jgi:hypothetical protein
MTENFTTDGTDHTDRGNTDDLIYPCDPCHPWFEIPIHVGRQESAESRHGAATLHLIRSVR